jgi:hypothetical protein
LNAIPSDKPLLPSPFTHPVALPQYRGGAKFSTGDEWAMNW